MGRDQSPGEEGGIGVPSAGTPPLQSQPAPAAQLHHRRSDAAFKRFNEALPWARPERACHLCCTGASLVSNVGSTRELLLPPPLQSLMEPFPSLTQ